MKCFIDEIRVLVEEWGSPFPISSSRLIKTLEGLRRSFKEVREKTGEGLWEDYFLKTATCFLSECSAREGVIVGNVRPFSIEI